MILVLEEVVQDRMILERKPDNFDDILVVAFRRNSIVVDHVPFNLALTLSAFLRIPANRAIAEVTNSKVNRGAGYGLEIPCKYHFLAPKEN